MHHRITRALAIVGAATLVAGGTLLTAAPASALPGSVVFSDSNCDIPTGGTIISEVDGVDFTVTNSTEVAEPLDYRIVLNYGDVYTSSIVLQPGESQRTTIPRTEDSTTPVQIISNGADAGVIGGGVFTVNCDPNASPLAVATISEASCTFPTGGIFPPSPGFSFTLDNRLGTGPADYDFVLDGQTYESGVVAAGEQRIRAVSLAVEASGTAQIRSVDADGEVVVLDESTYELDCDGPDPVVGYSPEATGAVTDASCALPTGGILVPYLAGVEYTLDNTDGTVDAAYAFFAGDIEVESGTVAAGEDRIRSFTLVEDQLTNVRVTSIGADGQPVVLDQKDVTLNCVADTPTLLTPTAGQVVTTEDVVFSGTGTPGDLVTVAIAPADLVLDDVTTLAAPLEGPVTYTVPVSAAGTFSVTVELANDDYVVTAVASRAASADGLVPASVSAPTTPTEFSVAAVAVTPVAPQPAAGPGSGAVGGAGSGSLASTGSETAGGIGVAALLALAGGMLLLVRRARQGARS